MYKKTTVWQCGLPHCFLKKLIIMKLSFILLIVTFFQANAMTFAQKVSMKVTKVPLKAVFYELSKQTGYNFVANANLSKKISTVSVDLHDVALEQVIEKCFEGIAVDVVLNEEHKTVFIREASRVKAENRQTTKKEVQQHNVVGTVRSADDQPMQGVSIGVQNKSVRAFTDENGKYSIPAGPNDILTFSFVGYAAQQQAVKGRSTIHIVLQPVEEEIDDVVVVGYGTQKKINLTGSVSMVERDRLARPVGQTSLALQGVASGVTVEPNHGRPGAGAGTIRIRGIGTLGNAAPLVLVDGVAMSLQDIDPNDIENVAILKDAAAAAIYGSRAANGVVLVTTRRGSSDKLSVNYNMYIGKEIPISLPKLVSGLDHMLLLNEANRNMGQNPTFSDELIEQYRQNSPSDLYSNTDWQKLTLTNNGIIQNHSIDVSGGSESIKVRAAFNYLSQNGIIPNTGYNRYSFRLNSDLKASEKVDFRVDLRGNDNFVYQPSVGAAQIFFLTNGRIPRNQEGLLSDGRYGQGWNGENPISLANDGGRIDERGYSINANFQGNWKPITGLNINLMYAPEFYFNYRKQFTRTIETYYGNGDLAYIYPTLSRLEERSDRTRDDNLRVLATYSTSLDEKHNIDVVAGFEQIQNGNYWFNASRDNFQLEDYQQLASGGPENQLNNGNAAEVGLQSYFGRVNYNFRNRYLFESNFRYDGSSRFAKGYKFGFFPSFSAGWVLSEEGFFSNLKDKINLLKVRGSWGRLGNQDIGNYPFLSSVDLARNYIFNEVAVGGSALAEMGNSLITWETAEMYNLALDIEFLNGFSFSGEYYVRDTRDILLTLPISGVIGRGAPFQNAGVVQNKGWDFDLKYRGKVGEFNYDVTAIFSDVKNKVVSLAGTGPYISAPTIRQEGYPIDSYYGYQSAGLFQSSEEVAQHATQFGGNVSPGDIKYVDQNGDGMIGADHDRVIIGSSIPRYTYSLNLNVSYKGIALNTFLQGVGKVNGYLYGRGIWAFNTGGTAYERHHDRWTPENPNASYPRLTFNYPNNEQHSDYWLLDASYLRLKNIQLSYTLPKTWIEKIKLNNLRLYAAGQNVFTKHKFPDGFDPEHSAAGNAQYPMMKNYTFGLTANF